MLSKFQIKKELFQDQTHEWFSFSVLIQGNEFQGLYHEGDINWFNPQPCHKLEAEQLQQLESNVSNKMQQLLA
ncbi:YheE family protein [Sporosarcina sp. ACRSM]|uniref:DUF5342 family protein n=1 Tax=Sporosarcina sp. ACRSM TaxID=2918216 RepID=UPI001EF3F54E|nr:DUF5342 family protein [Sporosarcina sp. ACRSM]MCG7336900.1 YheE family protein [Sporosarcina sp. ACRSM]